MTNRLIVGVASANGLGHALRIQKILEGFSELGLNTKLICTNRQARLMSKNSEPQILESIVEQEPIGLDGPSIINWSNKPTRNTLSVLSKASLVISDNVLWPVNYTKNFALCANFLWLDYWRKIRNSEKRDEIIEDEILLSKINMIFDYELFSQLQEQSNLRLKIPYRLNSNDMLQKKDEIWISCGTIEQSKNLFNVIRNFGITEEIKYFETFEISRLKLKPKLVIGRSGVGTITDCIAHKIPFIPFLTSADYELEFNQKVLANLGMINENFLPASGQTYTRENLESQINYAFQQATRIEKLKKNALGDPKIVAKAIYDFAMNQRMKS